MTFLLSLLACSGTDTVVGAGGNEISTVPEDAAAQLSAISFEWTDVALGYSNSQELTVGSVGEGALQIYEIKLVTNVQSAFYFDEVEDISLEPGQSAPYPIVINLDADWDVSTYAEGTLRVKTNDVDCVSVMIPLVGYPEGFTGTPAEADTASVATGADCL